MLEELIFITQATQSAFFTFQGVRHCLARIATGNTDYAGPCSSGLFLASPSRVRLLAPSQKTGTTARQQPLMTGWKNRHRPALQPPLLRAAASQEIRLLHALRCWHSMKSQQAEALSSIGKKTSLKLPKQPYQKRPRSNSKTLGVPIRIV